ncbi:MAG: hypothetical protein LUE88_00565, partial [Clostridiales bacterium]|nr:hypothetical protein [Clostridiales bacterium]
MKKKLALLMAAIMTVAMVPMTAFASTNLDVFDLPIVAEDGEFTTTIELTKDSVINVVGSGTVEIAAGKGYAYFATGDTEVDNKANSVDSSYDVYRTSTGVILRPTFQVKLTLTNAEFTEASTGYDYVIENDYADAAKLASSGVADVTVLNSKTAIITLDVATFNQVITKTETAAGTTCYVEPLADACILVISATGTEAGSDVTASFTRYSGSGFTSISATIAEVTDDEVSIYSEGVITFVEDSTRKDTLEDIVIEGLVNGAITKNTPITLKLSGNYTFNITKVTASNNYGYAANSDGDYYALADESGNPINVSKIIATLNSSFVGTVAVEDDDEIIITPTSVSSSDVVDIIISNICLVADKKASAGDVAKIKVSSKDFSSVTLEVAKMVEEAVTYSVDDDDLPVLYAGQLPQNNEDNEGKSLSIYIEENTGDILNTSRKATFTFPEGIEVVDIDGSALDGVVTDTTETYYFEYEIDENVVTIYNYGESKESEATDMEIAFILSASPSFEGDVTVTLGGEFDDVEFTVATVVAPYTVEAKTSEVLIDYRYVPVNEIVITEAVEGILKDGDEIIFTVEKMDFEDAGTYEVTEGDIEVDVDIESGTSTAQLTITVEDSSTEASTITISGLELYLDRTLPVGGYALKNVQANNILWENSHNDEDDRTAQDDYYETNVFDYEFTAVDSMIEDDEDYDSSNKDVYGYDFNGIFKYSAVTVNDSYVEVVTAARDQDDSTTSRKIVITIGATTMSVGTETVTLDAPAYINSEDYTMLP